MNGPKEPELICYTADVVVVDTDGRVLLILRRWDPYKHCWALPGGHVDPDDAHVGPEEPSRAAAVRELFEETGVRVEAGALRKIGTWDASGRDPRGRYSTDAYLAIVPAGTTIEAGDDAGQVAWWPRDALPRLAFDHADILRRSEDLLDDLAGGRHTQGHTEGHRP